MTKLHNIKLKIPNHLLNTLESGGTVQFKHHELLGHGDGQEMEFSVQKPILTKINKAIRMNKGLRIDGGKLNFKPFRKAFNSLGNDIKSDANRNFNNVKSDVNRNFNTVKSDVNKSVRKTKKDLNKFSNDFVDGYDEYGYPITKTALKLGAPAVGQLAGMAVGSYTNPVVGKLVETGVTQGLNYGISKMPEHVNGGRISIKKIGRKINNAMKSKLGRAIKSTVLDVGSQLAHQAILEETGNPVLANMGAHTVKHGIDTNLKNDVKKRAKKQVNSRAQKYIEDNDLDEYADLLGEYGNYGNYRNYGSGLGDFVYGKTKRAILGGTVEHVSLHDSHGYNGKLFLNGNPLLTGRSSNDPIQNRSFVNGRLSTEKVITSGSFRSPGG